MTPYSVVLLCSFVVAFGTAAMVWRIRPASGATALAAFMMSVAGWLGAHVIEIEASSFERKLLWADVQWVFAAVIPTLFLVFALQYTRTDEWLTRRRLGLLAIEPLVMIGLLIHNGSTRILWGPTYEESITLGTWIELATVATAEPNVGTFAHLGYATLCLAAVSVLLLDLLLRTERLYRWQGAAILAAVAIPWATAVLSVSSLEIVGTTPMGFTITGLAITFGLYQYRLFELAPIARSAVVENLDDGVLVVDERFRVVDSNPVANDLFDPNGESLVGEPIDDVLPVDVTAAIAGRGERRTPVDAADEYDEVRFSLGEGAARRYYELSTSSIADGSGRPIGWTVVVHDVTDRERRTHELERANRRLDEFASVVSHDLRNPLAVSKGYLELLEADYDPEHVEVIAESHDRMEQLIDDVLALARQGRRALDAEPVSLDAVATAAWRSVETATASLRVVDDRAISADRTQFQQLLENLFRNAVEHGSTSPASGTQQDAVEHGSTSPASGTQQDAVEHGSTSHSSDGQRGAGVTSPAARSDPDAESERESAVDDRPLDGTDDAPLTVTVGAVENGFFVADSGAGFDAGADVDRIFDSGYTTDTSGTGLGLAIVGEIAANHGWSVTATDGDSGGARFKFTGVEFVDADDGET